jgi:uncharacterized membrane protein
MKTISGAGCASSFEHAHPGTTPCSYSTCRSLISQTDGAARFRNMNTRVPTPNKQMPKKGSRPLAIDAAEGSIVVNAPVADVYEGWLAFEDYPKFITAIKRVRKLDANHFVATLAFNAKQYDAMLEIMLRVPERRLAWRTVSNGHAPDHLAAGVVSFESCSDRTTCITLKLSSSFGGAVSRRVDRYLHNFKRLIEKQ